MCPAITLETYMNGWGSLSSERAAVAKTVLAIAEATKAIADLVGRGRLAGDLGAVVGGNSLGDPQKNLDVQANDLLVAALWNAPIAMLASEELAEPIAMNGQADLAVALDPLDGSSNIDANLTIGTIFSVLPLPKGRRISATAFLQSGVEQRAAGYVIYGPHCAIVLTVGKGTLVFTLDEDTDLFRLTHPNVQIPVRTREYAINASNHRHWGSAIRAYIADCVAGKDGPRHEDFNTRWTASLVAECHRILSRGGVFLYPGDARRGYEQGRLRLLYEANPIAFLVEQAGGKATDGTQRILDITPEDLRQHTPLIFGSAEEVERIAYYKSESESIEIGHRSPLFGERGLFRR
jgi:fructose-1,6-bisphosphatase I